MKIFFNEFDLTHKLIQGANEVNGVITVAVGTPKVANMFINSNKHLKVMSIDKLFNKSVRRAGGDRDKLIAFMVKDIEISLAKNKCLVYFDYKLDRDIASVIIDSIPICDVVWLAPTNRRGESSLDIKSMYISNLSLLINQSKANINNYDVSCVKNRWGVSSDFTIEESVSVKLNKLGL